MSISNFESRIAAPAPRRRAARGLLFVALSAAAVPACQYYEADGTGKERQALVRPVTGPAAAAPLPGDPRAPLPPRG